MSKSTPTASNISDKWRTVFERLPTESRDVLYYLLAIHAAPRRKIRLEECCRKYSQPKLAGCTVRLLKDEWIELTKDGLLHCKEQWREHIVHHLVAMGEYNNYA